jgi:hypothetical protein
MRSRWFRWRFVAADAFSLPRIDDHDLELPNGGARDGSMTKCVCYGRDQLSANSGDQCRSKTTDVIRCSKVDQTHQKSLSAMDGHRSSTMFVDVHVPRTNMKFDG